MSTIKTTIAAPKCGDVLNLFVDKSFMDNLCFWESINGLQTSKLFQELDFKFKAHGPFVDHVYFLSLDKSFQQVVFECVSKRRFDIEASKYGVWHAREGFSFLAQPEKAVDFARKCSLGYLPAYLLNM